MNGKNVTNGYRIKRYSLTPLAKKYLVKKRVTMTDLSGGHNSPEKPVMLETPNAG